MSSDYRESANNRRDFRQTKNGPEDAKPASSKKIRKLYHIEWRAKPEALLEAKTKHGSWWSNWIEKHREWSPIYAGKNYRTEAAMMKALNFYCNSGSHYHNDYNYRGMCPDGRIIYLEKG